MLVAPEQVLDFWFGAPAANEAELMAKVERWFGAAPELDVEIRERFGGAIKAALAGELDGWADTSRRRLALVLVLDQFTRNAFRNDPKMYAGDPKAVGLVLDALDRRLDSALTVAERMFFVMPLLHAEDLALQRRVSAIAQEMAAGASAPESRLCTMHLEQTAKYLDVITRFGRFPHRNALLGRASTPEEEVFAKEWGARARPSGGPPAP